MMRLASSFPVRSWSSDDVWEFIPARSSSEDRAPSRAEPRESKRVKRPGSSRANAYRSLGARTFPARYSSSDDVGDEVPESLDSAREPRSRRAESAPRPEKQYPYDGLLPKTSRVVSL